MADIARPNFEAVASLIAASHQETAGQYTLAVMSYEAALKSSDELVPAKVIGDKLAAIQRDHPKEYADGLQITITPPAPITYAGPRFPRDARTTTPAEGPTAPMPSTLQSGLSNANVRPSAPAPAATEALLATPPAKGSTP